MSAVHHHHHHLGTPPPPHSPPSSSSTATPVFDNNYDGDSYSAAHAVAWDQTFLRITYLVGTMGPSSPPTSPGDEDGPEGRGAAMDTNIKGGEGDTEAKGYEEQQHEEAEERGWPTVPREKARRKRAQIITWRSEVAVYGRDALCACGQHEQQQQPPPETSARKSRSEGRSSSSSPSSQPPAPTSSAPAGDVAEEGHSAQAADDDDATTRSNCTACGRPRLGPSTAATTAASLASHHDQDPRARRRGVRRRAADGIRDLLLVVGRRRRPWHRRGADDDLDGDPRRHASPLQDRDAVGGGDDFIVRTEMYRADLAPPPPPPLPSDPAPAAERHHERRRPAGQEAAAAAAVAERDADVDLDDLSGSTAPRDKALLQRRARLQRARKLLARSHASLPRAAASDVRRSEVVVGGYLE